MKKNASIDTPDLHAVNTDRKNHNRTNNGKRVRMSMQDRIRLEKSRFNRLYSDNQKKTA
jgi:hypothetical protein